MKNFYLKFKKKIRIKKERKEVIEDFLEYKYFFDVHSPFFHKLNKKKILSMNTIDYKFFLGAMDYCYE